MARVVIAIPHSGTAVPGEIQARFAAHVDDTYLRQFSDVDTDKVYSLANVRSVRFEWSRYLVDPNRAEKQTSSGGVVPHNCFDLKELYKPGQEPDAQEAHSRILHYHRPYHLRVDKQEQHADTLFFIDGHSMAAVAPPRTDNPGEFRPDAVLSNLGDAEGNPTPGTPFLSCPPDLCRFAAQRLHHWMAEISPPPGPDRAQVQGRVTLNTPFPGGYGIRSHATPSSGVPGIQLELNQGLWVDEQDFIEIPGRIDWIRTILERWVDEIVERRLESLGG